MIKCKICKTEFNPISSLHTVCSLPCSLELESKKDNKGKALERKLVKAQIKALKPYSFFVKKTQEIFNRFIRLRDLDLPCISCGRHHIGQYHAGHYLSIGSTPHLRFNPLNCHKQCAVCNHYRSGNIVGYRQGLIKKIGIENVEWLENERSGYSPTIEELEEIGNYFNSFLGYYK